MTTQTTSNDESRVHRITLGNIALLIQLMNRFLPTVVLVCACMDLRAEGTVHFGNDASTRLTNSVTGLPVAGADGVKVALYWAPLGTSNFVQLGAAVPVGVPLPGLFVGGTRTTGAVTLSQGSALFQVRAWEESFGATYEAASASPSQGGRSALLGVSAILEMSTGSTGSDLPPTLLTAHGLTSFSVTASNAVEVAPTITCPPDIRTNSRPHWPMVDIQLPTPDVTGTPEPTVTCNYPPLVIFPAGTTNVVICTASNTAGISTCSFTVTVAPCVGGSVAFQNSGASLVSNTLTRARVPEGSDFLAALYYLPDTGTTPTELDFDQGVILEPPVGFEAPGLFNGGVRRTPASTAGGSSAWFQVRVWESVYGAFVFTSYEQARDYPGPFVGHRPLLGRSNILKVNTGNPCLLPPSAPATLIGLASFYAWPPYPDDTTPPVMLCPTNVLKLVSIGEGSANVDFTTSATDNLDPAPAVNCEPPSGSIFLVGTTLVHCTARDIYSNTNQCSFTVTVEVLPPDTTPPTLSCPGYLLTMVVAGQDSAPVSFVVNASDERDPAPSVICNPASGSEFPLGVTTVICTATDAAGNASQCALSVAVASCAGGSVSFQNGAVSSVSNALTMDRVQAGSNFLAALYYLPDTGVTPTDEDFDDGTPLLPNAKFIVPGRFIGGFRITPPTTPSGSAAWFQVRVWESIFGSNLFTSFETARDHRRTLGGRLPLIGASRPVRAVTGNHCQVPPSIPIQLERAGLTSFYVTNRWVDTAPPALTCPGNLVESAPTGQCSQTVEFAVTAVDDADPAPVVSCVPPSGSAFLVGGTSVLCTAQDNFGNHGECAFTVTVRDATPPSLVCPLDLVVDFAYEHGTAVDYLSPQAEEPCTGPATVNCVPVTGTVFPIGTTSVACVAVDGAGNTVSCAFTITVRGALAVGQGAVQRLKDLRQETTYSKDQRRFDSAISLLEDALEPARWIDETHVRHKDGLRIFIEMKLAATALDWMRRDEQSQADEDELLFLMGRLAEIARLLAVVALQDAAAGGVHPARLESAWEQVRRGDSEAAADDHDQAIQCYRDAWLHAALRVIKLTVCPDGERGMRIDFNAVPATHYLVEVSTNMIDWAKVGEAVAGADGKASFQDPTAGRGETKFYRVAAPD